MKLEETQLPGVLLLHPERKVDGRGYFIEVYDNTIFGSFVVDAESYSIRQWTVRGLHFQEPNPQDKLVRVVRGSIYDVILDLRTGKHQVLFLNSIGPTVYVPRGYAHGFVTAEPETIVHYKLRPQHERASAKGILWSDPALGIDWKCPKDEVTVSEQDQSWPTLATYRQHHHDS